MLVCTILDDRLRCSRYGHTTNHQDHGETEHRDRNGTDWRYLHDDLIPTTNACENTWDTEGTASLRRDVLPRVMAEGGVRPWSSPESSDTGH